MVPGPVSQVLVTLTGENNGLDQVKGAIVGSPTSQASRQSPHSVLSLTANLTSVAPHLLICNVEMIPVPTPRSCAEAQMS